MNQTSSHIMMICPANFGANPLTAESNAFQQELASAKVEEVRLQAREEWKRFVSILQTEGVKLTTFEDLPELGCTDSVFPNNWISFHENGKLVLYPMQVENRRRERRPDIVAHFTDAHPYDVWDWAPEMEAQNLYLESTGSMILDRVNKVAYACTSARTSPEAFDSWTRHMGYEGMLFQAVDQQGQDIYHTNVMMALGEKFAVVCLEAIADPYAREAVSNRLTFSGHKVVAITLEQMNAFAGNMLEIRSQAGEALLIMSQRAHGSLTPLQLSTLSQFARIVSIPIDVIETYGGGSVRCMMAEIFEPSGELSP